MIFKKIQKIIREQMKQGATPRGLAMTFCFALCLCVFPLIGTTTILCALFGHWFRLNQPFIHSLNYVFYPIQILLIPVFLYSGETVLGVPHLTIHIGEMLQQFATDWKLFFANYGLAGLHAIFGWFLIAPLASLATYVLILPAFKKFERQVL